ncbi:MAG: caspase family protein [Paludibacteraceae bacterium]|nr:caspase family protein [Paludibacteraceae bacterium]
MKRLVILGLLMTLVLGMQAATKRALVIGIGPYPASSGWARINGDKDIPVVEKLLQANGFQQKNIYTLCNEQATFSAICNQMEKIISIAQPGDFLYIQFSGHGQQITDRNGDEPDGYDEAWVPYDAPMQYTKGVYEGERHITDDRLNGWLHRMRKRVGESGKIIVVADACHSGDGTRGPAEEEAAQHLVIRGTSDKFIIPGASQQAQRQSFPIEWISISACKPYQCNYEYNGMGSLTYALYQERERLSTLTGKQLHQSIRQSIQRVIPQTQTPVVDMTDDDRDNRIF